MRRERSAEGRACIGGGALYRRGLFGAVGGQDPGLATAGASDTSGAEFEISGAEARLQAEAYRLIEMPRDFIGGAEDDQWLIRSPVASPIKSPTTMSGSNSQGSNTASGLRLTHAPFRCADLAPITSNGLAETSQVSSQE
jgi:hypothetical protein